MVVKLGHPKGTPPQYTDLGPVRHLQPRAFHVGCAKCMGECVCGATSHATVPDLPLQRPPEPTE